jgi:hypothetical protein
MCLVYASSATEAGARDLDRAVNNGTFVQLELKVDALERLPVLTFTFMNDWGGDSDKNVLSLRNVEQPCAAKHCTIIASAETMRTDEAKHPSGSTENLDSVISRIHGLSDLENNNVARLRGSNVFFPKQTLPADWTFVILTTDAEVVQFFAIQNGGSGSPAEMASIRLSLPSESAVFIVHENMCLGIKAGDASFPFREAVRVDVSLEPAPTVYIVHLYLTADLLAVAALMGNPGQSGHCCIYCRRGAPGYKKVCGLGLCGFGSSGCCELRSTESQAADLAAYQLKTEPKPTPVNGVSRPPVTTIDPAKIILPGLHVACLGPVNDEMKAMYNELRALDGVRQADLEKSDSLIEEIEEAEIELATSITIARELLGSSHLAVVALIGTTDAGQLVESEELGVWAAFSGALGDEAKDKFKKAKEEQQLPVRIGGHSTRAKEAAAKKVRQARQKRWSSAMLLRQSMTPQRK